MCCPTPKPLRSSKRRRGPWKAGSGARRVKFRPQTLARDMGPLHCVTVSKLASRGVLVFTSTSHHIMSCRLSCEMCLYMGTWSELCLLAGSLVVSLFFIDPPKEGKKSIVICHCKTSGSLPNIINNTYILLYKQI